MLAPVTHILPLATIRRKRILPVKGQVLVRAGQTVKSTDVIAETKLTPAHIVLDVARGLGVPANKAAAYIQRKVGDQISAQSIIASRTGLFSREVRSTSAGRVSAISGGQVLIEIDDKPFKLRAGLPGEVSTVEVDFGAVITTTGVWVQGVWGNEKVNFGNLSVLAKEAGHILSPGEIGVGLKGSVILAGYCNQAKALESAADKSIHGLILASMDPMLIPLAEKMPYPIIIIEGFGHLEMNSAAQTLISTNETREVSINAEKLDRYLDTRPEIIIPLDASGDPPIPRTVETFAEGQKVRMLRSPHRTEIGTILSVLSGLTPHPSGLHAQSAEVELEGGEKTVVPLANIEVLG